MALTAPSFSNLVVAFKVMASGDRMAGVSPMGCGDHLIAIGMAWGRLDDNAKIQWFGKATVVSKKPVARDEMRAQGCNSIWDEKPFAEFCEKNQEELSKLWARESTTHPFSVYSDDWCCVVDGYAAMAKCLNDIMLALEGLVRGDSLTIATGDIMHDLPWIKALLVHRGYESPGLARSGLVRHAALHTHSFLLGMTCERHNCVGGSLTEKQTTDVAEQMISRRPICGAPMLADRATNILFDALTAQQAAAGKLDAPSSS